MATRYYPHDAYNALSGTFPSAAQGAGGTPDWIASNVDGVGGTALNLRQMDTTIGADEVKHSASSLGVTSLQKGLCGMWVTSQLAAQTISAGTLSVVFKAQEGDFAANYWPGAVAAYIWRPSTGAKVATLVDNTASANSFGQESNVYQQAQTCSGSVSTAAVTCQAGDVLIVELWANHTQDIAYGHTCNIMFNGTTVPSSTANTNLSSVSAASYFEFSQTISPETGTIVAAASANSTVTAALIGGTTLSAAVAVSSTVNATLPGVSSPAISPTPDTLVFSDDFSGGSLDSSKWNDHIWYESSDPIQNYAVDATSPQIYSRVYGDLPRVFDFRAAEPFVDPVTGEGRYANWLYNGVEDSPVVNAGASPWIVKTTEDGFNVTRFQVQNSDAEIYGWRSQATTFYYELYKRYRITIQFKLDAAWDLTMTDGDGLLWQAMSAHKSGQYSHSSLGLSIDQTGRLYLGLLYPTTAMAAVTWPTSITWGSSDYVSPTQYDGPTTLEVDRWYTITLDFFADDRPPAHGGQGFINFYVDDVLYASVVRPNHQPDQVADTFHWDHGWYSWGTQPTSTRTIYFRDFLVEDITDADTDSQTSLKIWPELGDIYSRVVSSQRRVYDFNGARPFVDPVTGEGRISGWLYSNIEDTPVANAGIAPWIEQVSEDGYLTTRFQVFSDDLELYWWRTQASSYVFELYKHYRVTIEFKLDAAWDLTMPGGDGLLWQAMSNHKTGQFAHSSMAVNINEDGQLYLGLLYPSTAMSAVTWPTSVTWGGSDYVSPTGYDGPQLEVDRWYKVTLDFFADDRPPSHGGQGYINFYVDDVLYASAVRPNHHPDQVSDTFRWDYGWYNWGNQPTSTRAIYFKTFRVEDLTDTDIEGLTPGTELVKRTIDTDGKFEFTHGYVEVRAKLPTGPGVRPSAFLFNHDHATQRPAIDIFQAYCGGGSPWADSDHAPNNYAAIAWNDVATENSAGSAELIDTTSATDLTAGFHRYGVRWTPTDISWYFDDALIGTVPANITSPMYLLLNLWFGEAAGTDYEGLTTGSGNAMEVDWVRVWDFSTGGAASMACNVSGACTATAALTAPSSSSGVVQPAGMGTGWNLVFSDEFTDASLNSEKWNDFIWYESAGPANYDLSGGALRIWPESTFTQRTIDTDGKFYFTYGAVEIKAKMPIGVGVRPLAFLLNHDADERPAIDIFQVYNGSGWSDSAAHPNDYQVFAWADLETNAPAEGTARMSNVLSTTDLAAGYHTYGMKWTSTGIAWYFDGTLIGSCDTTDLSSRMYLLLNLWFGGPAGVPGASTPTGSDNSLTVDYVRVWTAGTVVPPPPAGGEEVPGTGTLTPSSFNSIEIQQVADVSGGTQFNVTLEGLRQKIGTFRSIAVRLDGVVQAAFYPEDAEFSTQGGNSSWTWATPAGLDSGETYQLDVNWIPAALPTPSGTFPLGAGTDWVLVEQDEFSGTSLDDTLWNDHIWYDLADPVVNYSVGGGRLRIWPDTGFVRRTIDTDSKFTFTFGFVEIKARLPIGKGVEVAAWLLNHEGASTNGIDIFKAYCGAVATGEATAAFHPTDYYRQITVNGALTSSVRASATYAQPVNNGLPDLSAGDHVYGVKWTSAGVTFYFDGQELGTVVTAALTMPMYLLLSVWFGDDEADLGGIPNTTDTPTGSGNAFSVDYIRIWRPKVVVGDGNAPPPSTTVMPTVNESNTDVWTLTFRDEFNNGTLDAARWTDHMWYDATGGSLVNYDCSNGRLRIWPANGFESRYITTDGKFSQQYGFFEIRAKLPIGKGPMPGFFLLNHDVASMPEVDVMVAYPGDISGTFADGSLHPTGYLAGVYNYFIAQDTYTFDANEDLSADFHTYGVRWSSQTIKFYYDGDLVDTMSANTIAGIHPSMALYLSLGYGSSSRLPDATTPKGSSNAFEIEYVRGWQFTSLYSGAAPVIDDGEGGTTTPEPGSSGFIEFYGDSTTAGWDGFGNIVDSPYPEVFDGLMTSAYTYSNEGVNSNTTTKAIAGTDGIHGTWSAEMTSSTATHVVMMFGVLDQFNLSVAQFITNLAQMVNRVLQAGKRPVVCTPFYSHFTGLSEYATAIRVWAAQNNLPCFDVFLYTAQYIADGTGRLQDYLPDGVHPGQELHTAAGTYIAENWVTKVVNAPAITAVNSGVTSGGGTGSSDPPPTTSVLPQGDTSRAWQLTFQDEFSGTSLDTTKWNTQIWYDSEPAVQNYSVEGGELLIWPAVPFQNRAIDTDGKFYQTDGFFECRARMPIGAGVWPAFWLFNHDTDYQLEIDIFEIYPGGEYAGNGGWSTPDLHPINSHFTVYERGGGPASVVQVAGSFKLSDIGINPGDLSADYHTYGLKWIGPDCWLYFDGQQVGPKITRQGNYTRRMYLLLQLWYGGASGTPTTALTPQGKSNAFRVQYVRVWK